MNETCLELNDVLWETRGDLTTQPLVIAMFAIAYLIIIMLGITGNLCVLIAVARTRSLQTVPNMFIVSLSCSDVVVCCISAIITPVTAFKKEWIFGSALCSIAPFIAGVSLCFSTFTLTAISIDRFMLIRFPTNKLLNRTRALIVIFVICLIAAGLSATIMLRQKLVQVEGWCGWFCTEQWGDDRNGRRAYGTLMVGVQFIVPLTIIIFCYTAISVRLGQSIILKNKASAAAYEWKANVTDQQKMATKRRQRTNRMLIAMVVAFSVSWFWSVSYNVLNDYNKLPAWAVKQEYFFGVLTHCIAMTSTVWNPLLYAMLNLQLRAAFIRLLPNFIYCRRPSLTGGETYPTGSIAINGDPRRSAKTMVSGITGIQPLDNCKQLPDSFRAVAGQYGALKKQRQATGSDESDNRSRNMLLPLSFSQDSEMAAGVYEMNTSATKSNSPVRTISPDNEASFVGVVQIDTTMGSLQRSMTEAERRKSSSSSSLSTSKELKN